MSVGKIFFAWVEPGEAFDPVIHAREDEDVFSVRISEEEGAFAVATVEIRNPRRGLLSPARRQRAFISAEVNGGHTLLFSGRVVGVPASITGETLELELIGRPDDHEFQQAALVSSMRADARYHPALVAEQDRNDLSAVLEGFAALPHWDRATGQLTLAPIANDGWQPVNDVTALEDSFEVSFSSAPLDRVRVELELSWEQVCPVISVPLSANPGTTPTGILASLFSSSFGRPATLTPDEFVAGWPRPGDAFDGGWTVQSGYLAPASVEKRTVTYDVTAVPPRDTSYTERSWPLDMFETRFDGNLVLSAFYRQPRRERVTVEVQSDLQPVVLFPEPEPLALSAEGQDVAPYSTLTVSTTHRAPSNTSSGFVTRTLFLQTDRAALARNALASDSLLFEPVLFAAISRADARLRKAARCVSATVQVPFEEAVWLSAASVVRIFDDRIPGGSMTGKVTALELVVTGDGECYAELELGASVGRAEAASVSGAFVMPYTAPPEPSAVTFCRSGGVDNGYRALSQYSVRNGAQAQFNLVSALNLSVEANKFAAYGYRWAQQVNDEAAKELVERTLQENPTELNLLPVSLEATDETVTQVTAFMYEPIRIVKDIDLEFEGEPA